MKVKKLLSLLAAVTMTVTAFTGAISASAETKTGTCGEVNWTLDSDGVLTVTGQGEMASPEEIYRDTSSEDLSDLYPYLKYKEDIKKIKIEEGVTLIGYCAFYKLPNLITVSIPSTVTAFPKSDMDYSNNNAFAYSTSLKSVELADGLSCIGATAFRGCTSLESIVIPSSIKDFGQGAFLDCTSLKDITLTEGLTVLGAEAFKNTAVESIYIPSSIEKWENRVAYLGGDPAVFENCVKLNKVVFGDGLKVIGDSGFKGCTSLEEIAFGDDSQLTTINRRAFVDCTNIKRFEFPENFNTIGPGPYLGCNSIEEIYVYSKITHAYNLPYNNNENTKVYCFKDSLVYSDLIKENITPYDISSVISSKLEELNTAVAEAEKYPEKDYTAESYGELKALLDEAATKDNESHIIGMEYLTEDIYTAIKGLEKKPPEDNTSGKGSDSSNSQQQTPNKTTPQTPTTARPIKSTRSAAQVKKDKSAAKKAMKQAKITKLTAKSKAKKKITVSWKKVKNAKGYQVQVSAKKNFKKVIYNKSLTKNKLTIKSSKIKSKKTYYVRVRAYATYKDANNATKKIYSKWVKKIRKVKAK